MPSARNSATSGADTMEEFIRRENMEFKNFVVTDYDSAKLVVIGRKYAITQSDIFYDVREDGRTRSVAGCEKTLWLKLPTEFLGRLQSSPGVGDAPLREKHGQETTPRGGWYWQQTGFDCDYLPSAEEIERLIYNLR